MAVALVTGGNQGLGLALVRALCRELGPEAQVYLTARDPARGEQAVELLRAEGLAPRLHPLDVTVEASVAAAADMIRERHGGLDVLISNAAARISRELPPAEQVAEFVDTNNHGTYRMLHHFLPLLNEHARLLVVASSFGSRRHLPRPLWSAFDTDRMSLEDVENVMDEYVRLVQKGEAEARGWPSWINIPSKVGQVASARVAARMMERDRPGHDVYVGAVCPGLVDTDASRPWFDDMSSAQSPDEAARDVLWLATRPAGSTPPAGELVQHRRVLSFG
ncbi:SDR family NAD(P)-dependent oxidoreductase [Micromonospora humidisoli]|uniref:SDR family NAD(P)-dependent oxidoreductase n=1 Tax=Micromonospora humidisoli TaxID=2807622 RepID=A0ABS2J451_9ACTN|nr:SDR family NAD(P)-dependent oxidoreductase [Micromonospora humidisoli]MBM7081351.1 SDR family NAD(P)-dependent oxidoreductase [Micromonospora humidisoli]